MARVRLKTTPRFWLIMLTLVCMGMGISIACESGTLDSQRAELDRLSQQKLELEQANEQLRAEAEFSQTNRFIEQQARLRGMIGQDEIRYVLGAEGEVSYAQGGN